MAMNLTSKREIAASAPTTETTLGALFLGWGVSSVAFGMFCLQVWTYCNRCSRDHWGIKAVVAVLWISELVHHVIIAHTCWHYIITDNGLGQIMFLEYTIWSLSTVVVLGAFIGLVVKLYFGFRVFRLGKGKLPAPILIWAVSVAQFALATTFTVKTVPLRMYQMHKLKNLGSVSLGVGAATDILTSSVLSYYLHTMRTGYRRSDTLIDRLIMFSVNTGALTSLCSVTVLVVYQLMPTNFVFIAVYFVLCKLYTNSCLATLNSRQWIAGRTPVGAGSSSLSGGRRDPRGGAIVLSPRMGNVASGEGPKGSDNLSSGDDTPSGGSYSPFNSKITPIAIGVYQEVSVVHDDVDEADPTYAFSCIRSYAAATRSEIPFSSAYNV